MMTTGKAKEKGKANLVILFPRLRHQVEEKETEKVEVGRSAAVLGLTTSRITRKHDAEMKSLKLNLEMINAMMSTSLPMKNAGLISVEHCAHSRYGPLC